MKKAAFGTRFDHAAMIVNNRFGEPNVVEMTYSGVKLRRFDERILWSRSAGPILYIHARCEETTDQTRGVVAANQLLRIIDDAASMKQPSQRESGSMPRLQASCRRWRLVIGLTTAARLRTGLGLV